MSDGPGVETQGHGPKHAAWAVEGIHHVAFATGSTAATDAMSSVLGLSCSYFESAAGFDEAMIPVGDSCLQVLTSTGPGVIETFLERRGPGLHHVAFRVDNVDAVVRDLWSRGVEMIDCEPRPGGGGTRIAFAHPRAFGGLLVEFVEEPS